ncbi:MAG TPA: hypothetical protein VEH04_19145 [Verrucomicrobiae bacterium]|nr:hypothetical protein [Verrucomicrobiae bacterium]
MLLVFALHLAIIFLSANRRPIPHAPLARSATYKLEMAIPAEWAALQDPTLFVLPSPRGFSGPAWMLMPAIRFQPPGWTEPLRSPLEFQALVNGLRRYASEGEFSAMASVMLPEPVVTHPRIPTPPPVALRSTLRIEGPLAGRTLLNPGPLPPVTDAFTNTVVDVLVDPHGFVFSSIVSAASGSTNDLLAVRLAQSLLFEPLPPIGPARSNRVEHAMMPGTLIFEWRPSAPSIQALP